MKANNLSILSPSWFPDARSKLLGSVFIGGGAVAGFIVGRKLFGDESLQRLVD